MSTKQNSRRAKTSHPLIFVYTYTHKQTKKAETHKCSMGTFWKVAVLPCTGVLAPICSCWHNATSFSISVTTKVFSSSTSWNRERNASREWCVSGQQRWFMVVLSGETWLIGTDTDRFTGLDLKCSWSNTNCEKGKGWWHKFRFSVVWCNPSATARSWSTAYVCYPAELIPKVSVTGAVNLLQLHATNDLETQALLFRVALLMTDKST